MAHHHDERADEKPQSFEAESPNTQPSSGNEAVQTPVSKMGVNVPTESGAEEQPDTPPKDSGAQTLPAEVEAKVQTLVGLVNAVEKNFWAIGDYLLELTAIDEVTLAVLEQRTGWKESRLSIYRATAKAFPHEARDYSRPFYDYEKVRAAADRIAQESRLKAEQSPGPVADALQEYINPDYVALMATVAAEEAKTVFKTTKKGKTKPVTKKLDKRATTELIARAARKAIRAVTATPAPVQPHTHLDRVICSSNESLLQGWLDNGIDLKFKLIGLDPPYGDYDKHSDGHLDQNTSAATFTGADNITADEALRTTCDTIRLLPPFLATGGTILLWQGCRYLRPEIAIAIAEAGLEVEICLVWIKKVPQPGHFATAWTRQCEFCYVIRHKGEKAVNHDGSPRANILDHWFDGPATQLDGCHWWRKPASLMEFVVGKCTHEGENVLDLFGCTGSLSIAATTLNRRFVYVESHVQNFEENATKILGALQAAQKREADSGPSSPQESKPASVESDDDEGGDGNLVAA